LKFGDRLAAGLFSAGAKLYARTIFGRNELSLLVKLRILRKNFLKLFTIEGESVVKFLGELCKLVCHLDGKFLLFDCFVENREVSHILHCK
jgi:hypothetical protein